MCYLPANQIPMATTYGPFLHPLPKPSSVWEDISLDFIARLPAYNGQTIMIVVIDRFSKAAHFGSLTTNFIACKAAELFSPTWFVCIMVILEA